jgi:sporulation protein YlmC with PRC-barrel domain
MKRSTLLALAIVASLSPTLARSQVAGTTLVGVAEAELRQVAVGWSAKREVLGQPVFNDLNERVGTVDDIVIAPDKSVSYAIINAGGFIGVAKHDVAIPVRQFKLVADKLVLAGATKDPLKASPAFEYSVR